MHSKKTVLFAPLNWGLGHATRCIPLIEKSISEGHNVLIASDGDAEALLKKRFPTLVFLSGIPEYNIQYPHGRSMVFHFLLQSGKLLRTIREEHNWLKEQLSKYKIDEVFSDNRYGLYSKSIPCYLITHQLYIRGPKAIMPLLNVMVRRYVNRFTECLVPDFAGTNNLSGELSHGTKQQKNIRYIGPLSRFTEVSGTQVTSTEFDYMAIISGPEPHRSQFEKKIFDAFLRTKKKCLIVCGQPATPFDRSVEKVRTINHLIDEELVLSIQQSKTIICRSGYSSIMDLHALGRSAILVPTPGQTEQEYLAQYHRKLGIHEVRDEIDLNLH